MPSPDTALTATLILFAGLTLQSTIGFGSALLAMPLLGALVGVRTATPTVGIISLLFSLMIAIIDRRHIDLRESWRLTLASFFGVPVGLFLLRTLPEGIILKGLGTLLIAYSLFALLGRRIRLVDRHDQTRRAWLVWPLGFIAGVLGGAYNTNGPPLVIFGTLSKWPPERFRATLQSVFFTTGLVTLLGQLAAGLWTTQAMTLAAYALPSLPIAALIGRWLNVRIPQAIFVKLVYALLLALGARLLLA